MLQSILKLFPLFKAPRDTRQTRRRGLNWPRILAVALTLWALFDRSFAYRIVTIFDYPFHFKEYREFGIRIPSGFQIHGIDVSHHNSRIDWQRVRKMRVGDVRVEFAFMKATEGTWKKDRQFDANWENARRAGIIRGAYHFFWPNMSPKAQADNFMSQVKLRTGDLPPVVDIEEERGMTRAQIQRYTKEFLKILEQHYRVKPILYTNRDFYKNNFADAPEFEGYRFWIAHYHVTALAMPDDQNWHFWQHSDCGTVNGINEQVDFNVFNGDSAALRRLCLP